VSSLADVAEPSPARPRAHSPSAQRTPRWILVGLVALATLPYLNALAAGFVYDDAGLVVEHPAVQGEFAPWTALTSAYWGEARAADTALWRPITTLSFAIDDAVADDSAAWMHAVNVALHMGVVLAGFALARRLGASTGVAAAASALFAVHPLHTEAVTWISGRAEILAALGVLVALLAATGTGRSVARRATACAAATLLATASKESAAFAPFAIAFLGWAHEPPQPRALAVGAASLASVLVYATLRYLVLGTWGGPDVGLDTNPMAGTGLVERLPTVLDAAGRYLALLVWPAELSSDYGPPVLGLADGLTVYGALGLAAALALSGAALARPRSLVGRAAMVALGAFAVASNLLVVIGTNFAERLFYLPSYGLLLIATALAARLPLPRGALVAVLVVVLGAASARTWVQNRAYESNLALTEATLAHHPNAPKMSYNRARELLRAKRFEEAVEQARWTLRLRPTDSWARIVLANALVHLERGPEAEAVLREGMALVPRSPLEPTRLLELLDEREAVAEGDALAEAVFARGLEEAPWPARAALAAQRRADFELAATRWERVIELHPESPGAWTERARVAYLGGDTRTAREAFERALTLDPENAEAANGLAWLLLDEGASLDRALELAAQAADSERADHLDTYARALDAAGRCPEALVQARRAAALDGEYAARRDDLITRCGDPR
jgi:tetratricopeptide (TPR) repeat protein